MDYNILTHKKPDRQPYRLLSYNHNYPLWLMLWVILLLIIDCSWLYRPVFGKSNTTASIYSHNIAINYHINNVKPQDIKRVELWYSYGKTGPWQLYGYDYDKTSPVDFEVPRAGYWRFLVVAIDRWGRCSLYHNSHGTTKAKPTNNVTVFRALNGDADINSLDKSSLYTGDIPPGTSAQVAVWVTFPSENTKATNTTKTTISRRNLSAKGTLLTKQGTKGTRRAKGATLSPLPNASAPLGNTVVSHSQTPSQIASASASASAPQPVSTSRTNDNAGQTNSSASDPSKTQPTGTISRSQQVGEYLRRGNFYFARQEWPQAAQAYRKAISIDSKCIDARLFLAKVLYKQNHFTEAQQQFDICLRENPILRDAIMYDIAQIQISANQPTRALATLQTLVKDNPRDYQAWLVLGDTAHKLKQSQLALQAWRKAAMSGLPVIARIAKQRLITAGD